MASPSEARKGLGGVPDLGTTEKHPNEIAQGGLQRTAQRMWPGRGDELGGSGEGEGVQGFGYMTDVTTTLVFFRGQVLQNFNGIPAPSTRNPSTQCHLGGFLMIPGDDVTPHDNNISSAAQTQVQTPPQKQESSVGGLLPHEGEVWQSDRASDIWRKA